MASARYKAACLWPLNNIIDKCYRYQSPDLLPSIVFSGFGQHGHRSGQLINPVDIAPTVHTAAHHSRQPQGLNFLHGAGERNHPLPPPLPCPAQVASGLLSTHLKHLLLLIPSHVPSDQVLMFQLCVSISTVVKFDVAFINGRERYKVFISSLCVFTCSV